MTRPTLALALLATLAARAAGAQTAGADSVVAAAIEDVQRELREAGAKRDRAAYERLLPQGFVFIHSNGVTETRQSYIDKAAAGAFSIQAAGADVEVLDEQLHVFDGHTAVTIARGVLRNPVAKSEIRLRSVQMYAKMDGRWRWVFAQSTPLPTRPAAAALPAGTVDAYLGRYEIAPGRTMTVARDAAGAVTVNITNRTPGELIPRSETEFAWFNPDVLMDAQVVFVKDAATGRVTQAIFRQDGRELWRARRVE